MFNLLSIALWFYSKEHRPPDQMFTEDYLDMIDGYGGFLGETVLALDHFILFVKGRYCPHSTREKPHLNDLRKNLFLSTNLNQ